MSDSAQCQPPSQPIDVVFAPDRDTFERRYVQPAWPVLIRGATDAWPARGKWNADYLAATCGDALVCVSRRHGRDPRQMTLAAFLDYVRDTTDDDPLYLANWVFEHASRSLLDDYRNPPIFERLETRLPAHLRPRWRWMFIGPAGSGTPLHVDTLHTSAWNAALTGRKRWRFYSPDQVRFLYHGAVDSFAPDFAMHPLFARARAIECVQDPGDLVFTPSGWWHQVVNERAGISVTENFINRANLDHVKLAAQLANIPHLDEALAALR
ncbi:cupin-like domain-containing protein [Burkholderia ubonensis]|uniref:JmjC domain-containing protein n=1 Tax=Burkholderia ubonensis TaxID=101571 RepID=A0AAW3MPB3_9BURK|nr:cupin-like domain-containing protein [Burkholderia ubonensis]KVL13206.1 hypothetical protein WJ45_33320 [Burkholderia ubonensis]KVO42591.1 hypothetical protein WJ75_04545 [Burkholderia ubonensis]KVP94095.1 hypothetical protein WJ96_13135 [Burkholderia ubonensis]KVQ49511.1 hypothetical protein WK04_06900 [Burkholderia ubonensis]KVX25315.1 hypothetical protein WL02_31060 [Burkholderia ubonensis]